MSDALFAVQDAVYVLLAGNASMQALLGAPARIYDHAPPDAAFPFVTLGAAEAQAWDDKTGFGARQIMALHVWSRYRGRKEALAILNAVHALLHYGNLTVTGHNAVACRWRDSAIMLDDDGLTYHGIAHYQITTQASG